MEATQEAIRKLIHSPARAFSEFIDYAEFCRDNPGITWGVPAMDERIIPARPGRMTSIIGRPGSAKTSLLIYLARREALRILERGTHEEECVIFTTWEQTVPELESMILADDDVKLDDISWGRADVEGLYHRGERRVKLPVWQVGMGLADAGVDQIRMTPEVVFEAIELMQREWGLKPTVMLFDYIQLIPTEKWSAQKWERVYEVVNETKRLAGRIGVPIYNAVQAGREVDRHPDRLPQLSDGQMTSAIEQSSDAMFGIARPVTFQKHIGMDFVQDALGNIYPITENLLVMEMLKQRGASPVGKWYLHFNPATFMLGLAQPGGV